MFDVDQWDKDWPGWFNKAEGKFLYDTVLAISEPATIIEIGSYRGRSTAAILQACMDSSPNKLKSVICIDNFSGPGSTLGEQRTQAEVKQWELDFLEAIELHGYKNWFSMLRVMTSQDWFKEKEGTRWPMFFIDGCHPEVVLDIQKAWPMLMPGGLLLCHDYDPNTPLHSVKVAIDSCGVQGQHCGIAGTSIWIARKS